MKFQKIAFLAMIAMLAATPVMAQELLFEDDFTDGSRFTEEEIDGYTLLQPSFDFDGYDPFFDHFFLVESLTGAGTSENPESNDDTTGLQVFVNTGGFESPYNVDGINFVTDEEFSGNIRVTIDVWLNYSFGGTTEFFGLGIFQSGDYLMNVNQLFEDDVLGVGGDGYFFSMNGDGDSGSTLGDFIFSEYTPDTFLTETIACGEWITEPTEDCTYDVSSTERETASPALQELFPEEGAALLGSPGNRWVRVVMEHIDGTINVYLNGELFHTYTDEDRTYSSGHVTIAYEDVFGSNGEGRQWLGVDYLSVEQLDTNVSRWSLY